MSPPVRDMPEEVSQVSTVPPPASTAQALGMLRSAMGYLAAADATAMAAGTQAQCLHVLEQVTAMGAAARASILAAFTSGQGYCADADYSPQAWLIHKTRISKGAAVAYTAWVRRAAAHPLIAAALAAGEISESFARTLCGWTGKLPPECRPDADEILLTAAKTGMDLRDLAGLAGEIYARSRPEDPDDKRDEAFEDRSVRLETTFDGAGVLHGDLTPECAAMVATVLDALAAPAGAEDDRSQAQRCHDALQEAMRRLVASGLLPERAGQPAKVWAHISLADLLMLDGSSALQQEWTAGVRAQWAAHRAAASAGGSDGAAWLEGDAARAFACDAPVTPVVMGDVNYPVLDELVRLCAELARLNDAGAASPQDEPQPPALRLREALEQQIIGKAVDLLSGPGGLASFLRRRQLGARLAGPSLPLDVGYSETIPAAIRHAVILRDKHCQWAGRCNQPASACEVHHVKHKSKGGKTSLKDCILLCWFHHQIVIHRWGWTLVLNPDGTTTAWNPDKTKVLRSHSPPVRPG
jgi:hypothetical protein